MNFEDARNQTGFALSLAAKSFDDDFAGIAKSPCKALHSFRDFVTGCDSPILFKNFVASLVRNLSGLLKDARISELSRLHLQQFIALAEPILIELEIDLAQQLSADRLQSGNEPIPKNGIKLDPKSLAIASAIMKS